MTTPNLSDLMLATSTLLMLQSNPLAHPRVRSHALSWLINAVLDANANDTEMLRALALTAGKRIGVDGDLHRRFATAALYSARNMDPDVPAMTVANEILDAAVAVASGKVAPLVDKLTGEEKV